MLFFRRYSYGLINQLKFNLRKGKLPVTISCLELHRSVCDSREDKLTVENISIPIPYGQISAKLWGTTGTKNPVLALHGWMDNAGTFDKLIPLLDRKHSFIAVDFPGHGFSSHKPKGCFYTYADMLLAVKYIKDYFKCSKLSMIGHSMGGEIAQLYAGLYPEQVDWIALLDVVTPITLPTSEIADCFAKALDSSMELEQKVEKPAPVYTERNALSRLVEGMSNEITPSSAEILLRRGVSKNEAGVTFTRDLRLRNIEFSYMMTDSTILSILSHITCNVLMLKAKDVSPNFVAKNTYLNSVTIETLKKNCQYFSMETVEGNHFVHLNNPENVSHLINAFIAHVN